MPGDPFTLDLLQATVAVSIRARHECRAILLERMDEKRVHVFQSAPDMNAGRSWRHLAQERWVTMFQSAPDMNAGRSPPAGDLYARRKKFQSAPDMNAGRSARSPLGGGAGWVFQSAPDMNAGRSDSVMGNTIKKKSVSIRARHECRAIPINMHRVG
ncbi:hypothetical protein Rfer_3911 [Rhodoferax ferrireducens T118]|nr:hypothetical protein Rfer_3911 [Rhodoferax ferrireducens T118]